MLLCSSVLLGEKPPQDGLVLVRGRGGEVAVRLVEGGVGVLRVLDHRVCLGGGLPERGVGVPDAVVGGLPGRDHVEQVVMGAVGDPDRRAGRGDGGCLRCAGGEASGDQGTVEEAGIGGERGPGEGGTVRDRGRVDPVLVHREFPGEGVEELDHDVRLSGGGPDPLVLWGQHDDVLVVPVHFSCSHAVAGMSAATCTPSLEPLNPMPCPGRMTTTG